MLSPTQAFASLPIERLAEAVRGRLCGQTGNDYGPAASSARDEPVWALIAGACGLWLVPTDPIVRVQDVVRLKEFETGAANALNFAGQQNQPAWAENVAGLLQALRLPPFKWTCSDFLKNALSTMLGSAITALENTSQNNRLLHTRRAVAALQSLATSLLLDDFSRRLEQIFGFAIEVCKTQPSPDSIRPVLDIWELFLASNIDLKPKWSFQLWQLALSLRVNNHSTEAGELEVEALRSAWLSTRERPAEVATVQKFVLNGASLVEQLVTQLQSSQTTYREQVFNMVKERWPEDQLQAQSVLLAGEQEIKNLHQDKGGLDALRSASANDGSYSVRRSACPA